jgi:hypothetical protein
LHKGHTIVVFIVGARNEFVAGLDICNDPVLLDDVAVIVVTVSWIVVVVIPIPSPWVMNIPVYKNDEAGVEINSHIG